MTDAPRVLLTNDDGIDAPGIRAIYDALAADADVTVVAPADDQSGTGMSRSWSSDSLTVHEHELGYAVEGTPTDCVAAGLTALGLQPDVVVSGCNDGPNMGAHILGRSGTVGAAMEAAFLEVPAIAVSVYDPSGEVPAGATPTSEEFTFAKAATRYLLNEVLDETFSAADYLNVNAPTTGADPAMRITHPALAYDVVYDDESVIEFEAGDPTTIELHDRSWQVFLDHETAEAMGTDRRAMVDGEVSVSPLLVPRGIASDETNPEGSEIEGFEAGEWL
ncbi:5'/3'-nucleotidase SurE [Halorussus halophilus]|uniref:5'/3'-nucleotidase SurE n=1 Tax=Halorussus halophilus TaxID=2650975 RepID=UPI001301770B|nr:5'/3'-nucleotidase SurE [Halorussus halophilus]